MPRIELAPLTQWITVAAVRHGDELCGHVAGRLGLGRRSAAQLLRRLRAAQWLLQEGTPRRPLYRPGALRQVVQGYALRGLMEDRPWHRDFAPYFELPTEVRRMAEHAFTELLNNAADHSGGKRVTVSMRRTPTHLQLLVADDGLGLFRRIERSFAIDDPQLAMLELAKGKLTSQPRSHSGHGLFFTAQLADVFDLRANAAGFQSRSWSSQRWHAMPPSAALAGRPGTSIFVAIALDTPRTLDSVLRAHSLGGAGYAFERTRVPLHLAGCGGSELRSRADAKRVLSRLERFRVAEIDFAGIEEVGHAFADELWRVFPSTHPGVELVPIAAPPRVAAMMRAVRAAT